MIRLIRFRRIFGWAIGIAVLTCPAPGQRQPVPGGGPAPASVPSTTPDPERTSPDPQNTPSWDNQRQQTQRPMLVSGKIALDSGGPLPDAVVILRVCNGNPRAEAYADSQGRFSFQLGENNGISQDARMGSFSGAGSSRTGSGGSGYGQSVGLTERDLVGCEIRASLAGYRSDMIPLAGRRYLDNPDIGTLVLHRLGKVEGVSISASSLKAPKDAKKAYEKGSDLLRNKKVPEARKEFQKAVELYPQYAAGWFELGRIKESQNDFDGARVSYENALAADARYVHPYRQLIGIYAKRQKWPEVADFTNKLLKLNPVDFPDAHYYNAISNYYLKNFDIAEGSIRELQKLDTQNRIPKASKLLGAILIEKQDYAGAAEEIRKYLRLLPSGQDDEAAKKQLAELDKEADATRRQ